MADSPPLIFRKVLGSLRPANRAAEDEKICAECAAPFTRGKRARKDFAKQRFCSKSCARTGKDGGRDSRFDASFVRVDGGCWPWLRSTYGPGYGSFCISGRREPAHRYAYERARGAVPAGMVVLHGCDNPSCVNPDHLTVGTQAENMKDAQQKGRLARGERQGQSKLTEQQAKEIKYGSARGADVAKKFGVGESVVSAIRNNKAWTHI